MTERNFQTLLYETDFKKMIVLNIDRNYHGKIQNQIDKYFVI